MQETGQTLQKLELVQPALLVDEKKVLQNIEKMVRKAKNAGVRLRPHFKTHQSAEIGNWFRKFGLDSITVSSVDMAAYFAAAGWEDITIAFPVNLLEMTKINSLAKSIRLGLLVDSETAVKFLAHQLKFPVSIWLKIDIGYGRVGVNWTDDKKMVRLIEAVDQAEKLQFTGLLTHFGHTYHAKSKEEIGQIYRQSLSRLKLLKTVLAENGKFHCQLSIGDTPSCSIIDRFDGIDEIRPGNFVFYDLTQFLLGVCSSDEIAVAVACPVVGKYAERNQIAVYGGAVHFSKESIAGENGRRIFGELAIMTKDHWQRSKKKGVLVSISQEHGILETEPSLFDQIHLGDLVFILPVHSCLTGNLYKNYVTLDGRKISRFQSMV